MTTILIAIDFSTASRNASLYGWQLGKAMNAKIILFTAYQVSHPIAALNVQVSHFDARMQAQKKLGDEAELIAGKESDQIEIVCEEGAAQEAILTIAAEKSADLIIVGMKGGGMNLKKLLGSTATSLLKTASIPVIIVPEEAKYAAPKNIVYASDIFLDTTIEAIGRIQQLTNFFSSKLQVVRVVNDEYEAVREQGNLPRKLTAALTALKASFHFPVNANISNGLNDFIKEHHTDLLVMSPHKHEWLERLFVKSETKDMIFHTHVPLLVLPDATVEPTNTGTIHALENYSADK